MPIDFGQVISPLLMMLRSIVEHVPADCASLPLIIQHQTAERNRDLCSLPITFSDAGGRGVRRVGCGDGCPNRIGGSAEIVGGDVGDGDGLSGGQGGELRGIWQAAPGRIGHERSLVRDAHGDLAANPRTAQFDRFSRSAVVRSHGLEEGQHTFGAQGRPLRKGSVILIGQGATAADGNESRIAIGGKDGHLP